MNSFVFSLFTSPWRGEVVCAAPQERRRRVGVTASTGSPASGPVAHPTPALRADAPPAGEGENSFAFPRRDLRAGCLLGPSNTAKSPVRGTLCLFPLPLKQKEAERRQAQSPVSASCDAALPPSLPSRSRAARRRARWRGRKGRRQHACRRSTAALAKGTIHPKGSASGHASWDSAGAFDPVRPPQPGGGDLALLHGRYPRRACPSPAKHLARRS